MTQEPKEPHRIFFETLGNQTRWDIINLLREGEYKATDIAKELGYEQSLISHHLKRLETCGFLRVQPNGKERVYSLNEQTVGPLLRLVHKHIDTHCAKNCINIRL